MRATSYRTHSIIRALCMPSLVLGTAGIASLNVSMPTASARMQDGSPPVLYLMGKVRDFPETNLDFVTVPSEGYGQYVGIVGTELGADGNPVFDGDIHKVLNNATTIGGEVIAPSMANFTSGLNNFTIVDGRVIPNENFLASLQVLGVDIAAGGTPVPVTMQARTDSVDYDPFGPYSNRFTGDVNDNGNPRTYAFPGEFPAGTAITVAGLSWLNGSKYLEADTEFVSPQVLVLRNGDSVPDITPFENQTSLAAYISDYVDAATNTVTIEDFQVIYLFELGTTKLLSSAADFQDLVVLLSLGTVGQTVVDGSLLSCAPEDDVDAELSPTLSDGGLQNQDSFDKWFNDTLGENMSMRMPLTLNRTASATYLFDDTLDPRYSNRGGFYPVDHRGLGNEEGGEHNQYFTYELETTFTYEASIDPFIDVASNADVWVYINGVLVIDMGGVHGQLQQRIDLNRLCLTEGENFTVNLFYAQRNPSLSTFRLETNLTLRESDRPFAVTAYYD